MELTYLEMHKYKLIEKLINGEITKEKVLLKLKISRRHLNRLIIKFKKEGISGFAHKNRGKKSNRGISEDTKKLIIDLYKTKYEGCNFTHYKELLSENEKINLSYNCIYTILRKNNILSPKVHRHTVKTVKKELKKLTENNSKVTNEQKDLIVCNNILDKYDSHSRIPRCKYFGECLEMDASELIWFGDQKTTLHGAIDDATGTACGLYFDNQETLYGYYKLFEIIWRDYGVPAKFRTDNRTVFAYNSLKQKTIDKDTLTQFGYACHQLGVELETTSIPERKSRIERLWETLQSRLVIELRLAGIKTIEDANIFLKDYTKKFNEKFALPINYTTSVFEKVDVNKINTTLAIIDTRKFDKGCSIKFKNKTYLAYKNDKQINYCKGTSCLVIQTLDGKLYCNVNDELSELIELPEHYEYSKQFDNIEDEPKTKKGVHVPDMDHPWKRASYQLYISKIPRHENVII